MKKITTAVLCAAILLSMAGVPYSAESIGTKPSSSIVVLPAKEKEIKPLVRVTQPNSSATGEKEDQDNFLEANQSAAAFAKSIQQFGAKTSAMLLNNAGTNQTYSPISFAYALGLLGSGAQGQTAREIAKALESSNMTVLKNRLRNFYNSNYSQEENDVLKIANSLWLQEGFPIKETFAQNAAKDFYASSYSVDFSKQSTADAIAKWISEQSGNTIQPSISVNPDQILSIINTLYFEGAWEDTFDASNNTEESFTLEDGSTVDATYMNQTFDLSTYYDTDQYTLFSVSFLDGQKMNFVLPKEGKKLSSLLDQETLSKILSAQPEEAEKTADVHLKLPKFSFDSEFDLSNTLRDLGLGDLLDGNANLSGITDKKVAVSNVKQESHVEVDENGCKAAAYTKIDLICTSILGPVEEYNFSLDRPFLFAITSKDDVPLFVGTVYNPLA